MPCTQDSASPRFRYLPSPRAGLLALALTAPAVGVAADDDGIQVKGSYIVELGHNARGGERELTRAAGQFLIGAHFDLERLWGVRGGSAQVTVTNRHGDSLTADAGLGLLQPAHSVYGRGEIWRLTQMWYEHSWDDTSLKIGRMPHSEDFATTFCHFTNLTLCGPAPSQIVSGYLYNVPVSNWGVRLRQRLGATTHLNVGVFESNPLNLDEDHGFYLGFGGRTGMLYSTELQWTPDHDGMDSTWKIGAWYDTSDSNDVVLDVDRNLQALTGRPALPRDAHHGLHANIHHQFLPTADDGAGGLWLIGNFAFTDQATNRLRSKMALGLIYSGPFAARPKDDIGFGIGRTETNDRVTDADTALVDAGLRVAPPQRDEYVAELYYSWRPHGALAVRPYVQYVKDPGGLSSRESATIVGIKLVAPFAFD